MVRRGDYLTFVSRVLHRYATPDHFDSKKRVVRFPVPGNDSAQPSKFPDPAIVLLILSDPNPTKSHISTEPPFKLAWLFFIRPNQPRPKTVKSFTHFTRFSLLPSHLRLGSTG